MSFPEKLSLYLEGDLKTGIRHPDGVIFRSADENDWQHIQTTESYWPPKQALPQKDLERDFKGPQILAFDENNKALAKVNGIWLLADTQVNRVKNWEAYYYQERDRVDTALAQGLDPKELNCCEIAGVIVSPEHQQKQLGTRSLLYYLRYIAELSKNGHSFKSLSWSADSPNYKAWLAGKEDSDELYERYVRGVMKGQIKDRVQSFYFALLKRFGLIEEIEGAFAGTRDNILKVISLEGGCEGEAYESACHRGMRLDGTGGVEAFRNAL